MGCGASTSNPPLTATKMRLISEMAEDKRRACEQVSVDKLPPTRSGDERAGRWYLGGWAGPHPAGTVRPRRC